MYVSRPDAKIFYQVTGAGPRDLVFHGPSQPALYSRMWKAQVPYLSQHFRVITLDPRGGGRSDRPHTGYDFATRYGDMAAVLAEAARPPFALVAFSCSSMLAIRYTVDHPEHVTHLVLIAGQYSQSLPEPFEEKVARVFRQDFDGWRARLAAKCAPEPHSLKQIEDGMQWMGETSPEIYIEALQQIGKDNVANLLPQLRVPTLVLHGTADIPVPIALARITAERIPGARLVTIPGMGHDLPAGVVDRLLPPLLPHLRLGS